jgi:hypothetical protein
MKKIEFEQRVETLRDGAVDALLGFVAEHLPDGDARDVARGRFAFVLRLALESHEREVEGFLGRRPGGPSLQGDA